MECCLVAQIVIFVTGVVGLVKGRVPLTRTRVTFGAPARIAGTVLLIPLPCYLVTCALAGVAIIKGEEAGPSNQAMLLALTIAAAVLLVCLLCATVICMVTAQPVRGRKRSLTTITQKDLSHFDPNKAGTGPEDRLQKE
jgi:hypothetical protein